MDTDMGSPIISRSSKEAMVLFFNENKRNFNKDDRVDGKVSIDATKHSEVLIANKWYLIVLGNANTNHYILFPEDGLDDANNSKKL